MRKRIVALVLLLALCLSACSGQKERADLTVIGAEDLALKIVTPQYALTPESYTESAWIGAALTKAGDAIFYLASDEQSNLLCSLNLNTMERKELFRDEALLLQDIAAVQDGRLFLLAETQSGDAPCMILCLDSNGTELTRTSVLLERTEAARELVWADGQVFLLAGNNLIVFDDGGKELSERQKVEVGNSTRMAVTGQGVLVLLQGNGSGDTISIWNRKKKRLEPTVSIDLSFSRVDGGTTWDLYLDCRGALFGYRMADGTLEKLFSWNALGLNSGAVLELEDGRLVTNAGGGYEQKHPLRILRPREDTGEESSVIRFATTGQFMDSRIRTAIQTWNGEHPECPIEVIDYSVYNTGDDQRPGQLRLATDVASGNGPDIYDFSLEFIDSVPSAPSFARRGLLEDLYPYLDADPDLKREDFLGGFFQAMEIGGGLYELTTDFYLANCFADASVVGDPSQWTYARLHEIMAANERYRYFFDPYVDRMWLLGNILACSDSKLIDWEKGTCAFESDYFRALLETIRDMPETGTSREGTLDITNSEGLLYYMPIGDVWMASIPARAFGENYCFPGLPELGNVFFPQHSFGISSLSSHKQECWEFLRQFWTRQQAEKFWLSPRRDVIRQQINQQWESAVKGEYDRFHPHARQAMEDLYSVMDSVTIAARHDPQIWAIVWQEANAYFSGGRNVEDAMRNIQSRVSIYLAEQG